MVRETAQPKNRGDLRLALGSVYFTCKRYLYWLFGGARFAKAEPGALPYTHFCHATPLMRQLKDVDMWMQENKVANLRLAAARLDGVTLRPGQTLSMWRLVGRPTRGKGYLPGMVLKNGTVQAATGGGLCQLSNLIFWMTVHTPLTVTERHRHGYDVFPDAGRTQPFGSGATCFYNYGDLMLRNDTQHTWRLTLEVTDTELHGAFTCAAAAEHRYEVYEKAHLMRQEAWGGYTRHNLLHRRVYDAANQQVGDEFVAENHAVMMYAPLISQGDGVQGD